MRVAVRVQEGAREAVSEFLQEPIKDWAGIWRRSLDGNSSLMQEDSVEFLESALSKWSLYQMRDRIVRSQENLIERVKRDQNIDLLAILTLDADWSGLDGSTGMCQFRRTWCHNFAIDYVAVHPALLGKTRAIAGVGTALLYSVATIAKSVGAKNIWLEMTDLSAPYYSNLFGTSSASDHLILPTEKFYEMLHRRFAGAGIKT